MASCLNSAYSLTLIPVGHSSLNSSPSSLQTTVERASASPSYVQKPNALWHTSCAMR